MDSNLTYPPAPDFPHARTNKEGIEFIAAAVRNLERKLSPFNSAAAIDADLTKTLQAQLSNAADAHGAENPQQVWNSFAQAAAPVLFAEQSATASAFSHLWTSKTTRAGMSPGLGLTDAHGRTIGTRDTSAGDNGARLEKKPRDPHHRTKSSRSGVFLPRGSSTKPITSTVPEVARFLQAYDALNSACNFGRNDVVKVLGLSSFGSYSGAKWRAAEFKGGKLHPLFTKLHQDPEAFIQRVAEFKGMEMSSIPADIRQEFCDSATALPDQYLSTGAKGKGR